MYKYTDALLQNVREVVIDLRKMVLASCALLPDWGIKSDPGSETAGFYRCTVLAYSSHRRRRFDALPQVMKTHSIGPLQTSIK
jgi:hypothetical protein